MAGMNQTPSGERVHIGFFGRRNAGKSSVVNAVTGQDLAVVSEVRGTTTDPVSKAMELLPLGPVVIIDTPGFDDEGSLGELRVRKTRQILNKTDIAVLVVDSAEGLKESDRELISLNKKKKIPHITVFNKSDLIENRIITDKSGLYVSALTGDGITELKERIAAMRHDGSDKKLVADKISAGDLIILVVPIDKAAPKGRLILPQQQAIRALDSLGRKPDLVITDSQVFGKVDRILPEDIPLTSFSILMARYKGLLDDAVRGVTAINDLKDGDTVLIAEGCTHHRQCGDIGSVKIPAWLSEYTGKELIFKTVSGTEYPEDLSPYAMVVHCGGCMLNEREVSSRAKNTVDQNVPITNYGTMIAFVHGILKRSLGIFPELEEQL